MSNYQMRRSNGGHLLHIVAPVPESRRFSRAIALCGYSPGGGRRGRWVTRTDLDLTRFAEKQYCPKCMAKYKKITEG